MNNNTELRFHQDANIFDLSDLYIINHPTTIIRYAA